MKKRIFVVLAILTGSVVFAQQKKEKQTPPPPPKVNLEKFVPPPPPPKPKTPPAPKIQVERFASSNNEDYQLFLNRNPTVKGIGWSDKNVVRIHLKSGKEEVYDLNNEDDAAKLKDKYGELPTPPPPPPPPKAKIKTES